MEYPTLAMLDQSSTTLCTSLMHFGFLLHGEGIVFSFLAHLFISVVAVAVFVYGILKYKSFLGATVAILYVILTLICVMLSISLESPMFDSIGWTLTLPWNMVVPCYNLDSRCPLTEGLALVCATLNATVLYFVVSWVSSRK